VTASFEYLSATASSFASRPFEPIWPSLC